MFVYRLSPPLSLPFPRYFSPNREPVHRLVDSNHQELQKDVVGIVTVDLILVYFHPITLFLTLQWHTRVYEVDVNSFKNSSNNAKYFKILLLEIRAYRKWQTLAFSLKIIFIP